MHPVLACIAQKKEETITNHNNENKRQGMLRFGTVRLCNNCALLCQLVGSFQGALGAQPALIRGFASE